MLKVNAQLFQKMLIKLEFLLKILSKFVRVKLKFV
jgi:hypothetical protein